MTMTYKAITGRITIPGTDLGIRAKVTATPMSTDHVLAFDDRATWGPRTVETDTDGNLPTGTSALRIPQGSSLGDSVLWKITAEPIDKSGVSKWIVATTTVTADTTIQALAHPDVTVVTPTLATTVGENAAAAQTAATDAAAAATSAQGWADAASSSAADAATDADLAAASATEAADNANGFSAGTATALAPGATPTVSITGTAPSRVINLGIPAGTADDASMTATYNAGGTFKTALSDSFAGKLAGEVRSKVKTDGTDQTAALQAELDAIQAAGGGTLVLPRGTIRIDGVLSIANDGSTKAKQPPLKIVGQGAHFSGGYTEPIANTGTILDIKGTHTHGKIRTVGLGLLTITGITFTDSSAGTTPFIYTTNTTIHILNNGFVGAASKTLTACDQDAIVCGGTTKTFNSNGLDDAFQGYGTIIAGNFFAHLRRAVYGRVFFNANVIRDNAVWNTCGTNVAGGACIDIDGDVTDQNTGNVVRDNLFEMGGYPYAVRLNNATTNTVADNNHFDPTATTLGGVYCSSTATYNTIRTGYLAGTKPGLVQVANASGFMTNTHLRNSQNLYSTFTTPVEFKSEGSTPTLIQVAKFTPQGSGAQAVTIQPGDAGSDARSLLVVKRNDSEATNPGTTILNLLQRGDLTLGGATAGNVTITDGAGAAQTTFTNFMRYWTASGAGGAMIQDSGTGGSYLTLKNFGVKFQDHNGGPLRVLIGGSADQIRFGPNGLTGPGIIRCTGTPEGTVTAPVGSIALRDNGAAGTVVYVKESGTGNTGWVSLGGLSRTVVTKTANYTATLADHIIVSNGAPTITLPDPTTVPAGRQWTVKNINATAVTVASAGTSKTIDGAASQSLAQWAVANYISDGTQWLTV